MFNITWCTRSTGALSWGFLTEVKTGLISNYFSKGVKSCLNSDPLSNTTLRGREYLHSHVLLIISITQEDDLSMYSSLPAVTSSWSNVGILKISNQPMVRSIIFMQVRLALSWMAMLHGCCCLIDLIYLPIRYTCTESHGFSSAIFLGGRYVCVLTGIWRRTVWPNSEVVEFQAWVSYWYNTILCRFFYDYTFN